MLFGAVRLGQPERATALAMTDKKFNPLPGFGLTMGYTLLYLSVLVLVPLAGLFLRAFHISPGQFWGLITNERALAAFKLTFGASLLAASLNAIFGVATSASPLAGRPRIGWISPEYTISRRIDLDPGVSGKTGASLFSPKPGNGILPGLAARILQIPDQGGRQNDNGDERPSRGRRQDAHLDQPGPPPSPRNMNRRYSWSIATCENSVHRTLGPAPGRVWPITLSMGLPYQKS